MNNLTDIFKRIGNHTGIDIGCNDKGGTHSYIETYEKLFKPFQLGCNILEIGIALGHSIQLWDEYFENSNIYGADLSIIFTPLKYKNKVTLIAGDGTKKSFVDALGTTTFDIIIDDGSHVTQDQITTFNLLKHKMNKGGVYIIEDLLALDIERKNYLSMASNVEIIDLRKVKGRFDDALVIIKF